MFDVIRGYTNSIRNDVLSGITVAFALVPEAVAFAFIAGLTPMTGLYAAFLMGLITAIFGGRPGMISGATGATAVVMVGLVLNHGKEYLFAALLLTGAFQIFAGVLRLGKYIRIVPYPVMLGFVNGLAIVIFKAQFGQFMVRGEGGEMEWMQSSMLLTMGGLIFLTMMIIHFLPKLTKAVPSSLVAILVVTALVHTLGLDARTVIDFVRDALPPEEALTASLEGVLPTFSIPMVPFSLEMFKVILPYALILAAVGLIESLLTMTLIDEVTNTRGQGNKECIGQGLANTANGFLGGMGGCAMIGQSMINIQSGGRGRLSGITAAVALLGFILFGADLIEMVPLAALVGVMFMVVLGTFEWSSFRVIGKVPVSDAFILILVSTITVFADLAIAVIVGVIVSAVVFAWQHAQHILISSEIDENGVKIYKVKGPIFFGSVANFKEAFTPEDDPESVVVEFQAARIYDHSGIEALDQLSERYQVLGKGLHLRHLSQDCVNLLTKAKSFCDVNLSEDPKYRVADDKLA